MKKTVVLAIKKLPAASLGCYGNLSVATPCFDQLASEGVTFNWHFADSTSTVSDAHPWNTGRHSFSQHLKNKKHSEENPSPSAMKERFEKAGIKVRVENEISSENQNAFSQLIDRCIEMVKETIFQNVNQPTLLWMNVKGISESQATVCEEVEQFDAEVGRLFDLLLSDYRNQETLFIVTAAQGEGCCLQTTFQDKPPLSERQFHTPLILLAPTLRSAERRQELVQTVDLLPTIEEWLIQHPVNSHYDGNSLWQLLHHEKPHQYEWRDSVFMQSPNDHLIALRTADYFLIQEEKTAASTEAADPVLILKPDDPWDVFNVAQQHPQLVEELRQQLSDYFVTTQ